MTRSRFGRYVDHAQRFGARAVLFQEAAASLLDLNGTDLTSFRLVQRLGPCTASDLARELALTRASVSAIVDKLVSRRLLTRERDTGDRRRWTLRVAPDALVRVDALYKAHDRRMRALLAGFTAVEFDAAMRLFDLLAAELRTATVEFTERAVDVDARRPRRRQGRDATIGSSDC